MVAALVPTGGLWRTSVGRGKIADFRLASCADETKLLDNQLEGVVGT